MPTERFLVYGYPVLLGLVLLSWLGLLLWNGKILRAEFRPLLSRWSLPGALVLLAAALALRLGAVPHRHRVFFDEYEHLNIAENLARSGAFAESLAGGLPELDVLAAPTWPGGFHVILAGLYKVFGASEAAAYGLNAALSAATVLLVFLLALHFWRDRAAALFSGIVFLALPLHLQYSGSADLTSSSLFWIAASLLALSVYRERRTLPLLLLLLSTLLYAAHTRFESVVLIPVALLFLAERGSLSRLRSPAILGALAAFSVLLSPLAALVLRNRATGIPGFTGGPGEALDHLARIVPQNLYYLLKTPANALVLLPASLYALVKPAKEDAAATRMLVLLAAAYFLFYASFFRGDFNFSSEDRYALALYLPWVLLAGAGVKSLGARWKGARALAALAAGLFALLSWPYYAGAAPGRDEAEHRFIVETARLLPADSYVISYSVPAILVAARRPAVSPYLLLERGSAFAATLDRGGTRPLFLLKDVWWGRRAADSARLEEMLRRDFEFLTAARTEIGGEEYAFYRLSRKPVKNLSDRAHAHPPGRRD